ncbi:hypothetical protein [Dictyobacter formicarum]|uniref:SLC26A/SulP transporter domain-containing protein n=1 Tax=Dictyobacter formicarum TaxID=2778368 RepID=A0ABQ3VUM6_9CHLR|nr:hypothetical protein [Dictyobacter formicarum]GHO89334.1 hypothetical protein KSZ_73400 [Dictyobacter formicarum]
MASIGLNLSGTAIGQATGIAFSGWMAAVTVIAVALIVVYAPGSLRRLSILVGGIVIKFGNITFDGIGVATFTAIVLYQILREKHLQPEESVIADSAVGREEV